VDSPSSLAIGDGDERFILVAPEGSQRPLSVFDATLVGPRLDATLDIYVDQPGDLPAFFAGLAGDWRGWDGVRRWESLERDLRLACRHDRVGRVTVEVTLGRRAKVPPYWQVTSPVSVEPGQLLVLATAVRNLLVEP
jgi:hypothetical protein